MEESRRRWGDRRDGKLIRDLDAMHYVMGIVYPHRTDNEAYISERIDLENVKAFLAKKNYEGIEFKYTIFHVVLTALVKTITLRPKLNRFIVHENFYQRNEITAGFVIKKSFDDRAEEGIAFTHAKPEDTIDSIHADLKNQITGYRGGKHDSTGDAMDMFNKLPRWLSKLLLHIVMWLDKRGKVPAQFVANDANYASVFLTNLGSIKLKCGYHHLSNWGTTSLFVVIGEKKWTPLYNEHGFLKMCETLDIGLTVDERIADGYYYAKSIRLFKHLMEHPELLERPIGEEVDYE